ncbi:MAG: glycerophosphodiester phosphodiesterase [Firmicutes bacterium]|nr:glycerophosphodiester phosphodiesterase [Bacillota bacterium]
MTRPWVIAHRGASGHAPENTLAAFRRAVELGAQFIETDLRLTRDSHLVALHDETLDRTTSGHGRVEDYTLAELRALDAGAWFAPEFAGERIPTLAEILAFSHEHDIGFYLEIKPGGVWSREHPLVGALRGSPVTDRLVVLCFDAQVLKAIHDLDPLLMTGLLEQHQAAGAVERALAVGARQLAPHWTLVSRELVQQAHAAGLVVVPWTVNDPAPMCTLLALGVDGIVTDYPDRLVEQLRAR